MPRPARFFPDLLLVLLILTPLLVALLPGGLPNTADGPVHFHRAVEMVQAWQEGVLIPRWSANLGRGYGLPLFVFAPPLPYFVTALGHQLGLPLEVAYKLMLVVAVAIAGLGAYQLGRVLFQRTGGVVAAAALLYAPILLREIFVQGNAGQLWAWAWAPWGAWGVLQLLRAPRLRHGLLLALAVAGVLLSHNAAALLLVGMVALLAGLIGLLTGRWRNLLAVAGSGLLGLGLSAWFWLPALVESRFVRLDRIAVSDYHARFVPLRELLAFSPRLDAGAINPYFPLTLGALQLLLAGLGLAVGVYELQQRRAAPADQRNDWPLRRAALVSMTIFTLGAGGMATRWSAPLWALLPFVDLFEFPFRWHGFTSVGLAWLCAVVVRWPTPRLRLALAAIGPFLLIGAALVNLQPATWPLGAWASTPEAVVNFETRTGAIGTTSLGEFDPIWTGNGVAQLPVVAGYGEDKPVNRLPSPLPPGVTGSHDFSATHRHRFQLTLATPLTLTLQLLYFPGWQATVDGHSVALAPNPTTGLLDIALPAGDHQVEVHFGETPLRRLADWLTISAGVLAGGLLVAAGLRRRGAPPAATSDEDAGLPLIGAILGSVALLVLLQTAGQAWFRRYTPPEQAPVEAQPPGATFGSQLRLLGSEPPPAVVHVGEPLQVITYWRSVERLTSDYGLFLHLDDPDGQTVAAADFAHPADIPTSHWSPNLYVRAPLQLIAPPALPPIRYQLSVGVVDRRSGEWLATEAGADLVAVGSVWLVAPEPAAGAVRAHFGPSIVLRGFTYERPTATLTLIWQSDQPLAHAYTIFVHALDSAGQLLGQIDGTPYANRYPTAAWRPHQRIEDVRPLAQAVADPAQITQVAIGLYDPASGARLAATDAAGRPLADNALVVAVRE